MLRFLVTILVLFCSALPARAAPSEALERGTAITDPYALRELDHGRFGLTRVMLPARNRRDFDEIPLGARDKLEFIWLERVDDAIAAALEGTTAHPAAAAAAR